MPGALLEILMDSAGDVLPWVLWGVAAFLVWIIVLPTAALLLTLILLIISALGDDPFEERLRSLYARLLAAWKDGWAAILLI